MIVRYDLVFRLIIAAQLVAMGVVRGYFGAPRAKEPPEASPGRGAEPASLAAALGVITVLHFGAIFVYLANPILLRWSGFEAGPSIRWIAIVISWLGVAGEIWAAASLGASYSPVLRISNERIVITNGPYRWIRHPLYAFWILVMVGWALAAQNWFILVSGTVLVLVLRFGRVPREEAMMVAGFGESYRRYMTRTG